MATLTGNTVASTYKQLLKVTSEGIGADASAKYIEDGLGTDSALSISTTRIGIGTASPGAELHVFSETDTTDETGTAFAVGSLVTGKQKLYIGVNNAGGYSYIGNVRTGQAYDDLALQPNGGNVGIGTASPAAESGGTTLHIAETGGSNSAVLTLTGGSGADGSYTGQIQFNDKDDTDERIAMIGGSQSGTGTPPGGKLHFFTQINGGALTEAMTIDASQNVGMAGTLTVNGDLIDVTGAHPTLKLTDSDDSNYGYVGYSDGALQFESNGGSEGGAADTISFMTNGGNVRLKLDDNSRISLSNNDASGGVGTTIFGYLAGNSIRSGVTTIAAIHNTFIGHQVADAALLESADYNTGVGSESLGALTAGAQNTSIGAYALNANTTGDFNVAMGVNALIANVGTDNNTGIGTYAGQNTIGADNTYVGFSAGKGPSAGANANNVGVGSSALLAVTTGSHNVAIGAASLDALTTGGSNIAIGYLALTAAGAGESSNVAIGESSMSLADEGSGSGNAINSNVAIGVNTLTGGDFGSTGSRTLLDNIAIGTNALNSTGTNSQTGTIAIGKDALTALTSGASNVAIGYQASQAITSGLANVSLGYAALSTNVEGDYNTAIGHQSLQTFDLANVGQNTAVGINTLQAMEHGVQNTAIGAWAMDGVTSGASSDNVAIGVNAMGGAIGAEIVDDCVAIGSGALSGALDSTNGVDEASGTVAIGKSALAALTSGAGNVAVGYKSMDEIDTGSRNTTLGFQSMMNAVGGSNSSGSNDSVFIGWNSGGGAWLNTGSNGNTVVGSDTMSGAVNGAGFCSVYGFAAGKALNGSRNSCFGYRAGDGITTGTHNLMLGVDTESSAVDSYNQIAIGFETIGNQDNGTVIGSAGIFQFASKEYTCDHADAEDGKSAASEASPLKLPAYSIIKSISVIVKTLSNLGTYNVALYHSTDTAAPADDTALGGTPVEVLGAGASDTCSGNSASAVDIALGSGTVLKQSYYNAYGGAGLPVGTADRYIHVGQAGTGNGDTDPSTAGVIKVLVEYVGLD